MTAGLRVVDSSAWLEFLAGGPRAEQVAGYVSPLAGLLIPAVVLYEVYKKIKAERGEEVALERVSQLTQGEFVPWDDSLALLAANLSLEHHLSMADAAVYATTRSRGAKLITLDKDFKDLPDAVVL